MPVLCSSGACRITIAAAAAATTTAGLGATRPDVLDSVGVHRRRCVLFAARLREAADVTKHA